LTVEAGVEVKFDSGKSLQVFGELVAQGTSSSGITFTSTQDSKAAGDWGQIVFYDSSVDAVFDGDGKYVSGSILEYCTVEYGSGILLKLANSFINQSTIRYNSGAGIKQAFEDNSNSAARLQITNNTISNNHNIASGYNDAGGISISWQGLNAGVITGNTISNNIGPGGGGIYATGSLIISGNTIENNKAARYESYDGSFRLEGRGGGIRSRSRNVQILNNIIKGNAGGGIAGGGTIIGNTIMENSGGGFSDYDNGSGTFTDNRSATCNTAACISFNDVVQNLNISRT
jgi:hypothetical protein